MPPPAHPPSDAQPLDVIARELHEHSRSRHAWWPVYGRAQALVEMGRDEG